MLVTLVLTAQQHKRHVPLFCSSYLERTTIIMAFQINEKHCRWGRNGKIIVRYSSLYIRPQSAGLISLVASTEQTNAADSFIGCTMFQDKLINKSLRLLATIAELHPRVSNCRGQGRENGSSINGQVKGVKR
jgi:hypothetical protein